ncbi:MAG: hypothetical protein J7604_21005 [Sporocytophaga sp.]|uniref:hypothetical protein n=1 Tax=Sporocytophaga sp. TaxID=2231183 RepID=UPI001B2576F1|nr:hypothetical protein [Sporocytophaga sp.]MBO9702704.1 hypothetical protein [Sporocytophaga sp.]
MKNKLALYAFLFLVFAVLWNIGADYYARKFHENIQQHKTVYVYDQEYNVINPVLIITDIDDKDSLISYYQKQENGVKNPGFNFALQTVPFNMPCYLLGYNDSLLAEIVYYENNDLKSRNYVKGYVFSKKLHNSPPPDSLLKNRLKK